MSAIFRQLLTIFILEKKLLVTCFIITDLKAFNFPRTAWILLGRWIRDQEGTKDPKKEEKKNFIFSRDKSSLCGVGGFALSLKKSFWRLNEEIYINFSL
jgi:hypothetical protein